MKANYRISENDYVNAMWLFGKLTPRLMVIYSTGALLLLALAVFGSQFVRGAAIGGLAGGLFVTVVGRYIFSPIVARRNYRKYRAIHEEFTIELLDDGIRYVSSNADGKLLWNHILKWRQNENYILIYPMPRLYYVLPKSVASSGFDISFLISQLTRHVGNPV